MTKQNLAYKKANMSTEAQRLLEKWQPLLESQDFEKIPDDYTSYATAVLLDNQDRHLTEAASVDTTGLASYDPIVMNVVRQAVPSMIAFDLCGVQPMRTPTGYLFSMIPTYGNSAGARAGFNEADSAYAGNQAGVQTGTNPYDVANFATFTVGGPMDTATAESAAEWAKMGLKLEKQSVAVKTYQLQARVSIEMQQDLKSLHGIDANSEMTNVLSNELSAEIDRNIVRTMYKTSVAGAQWTTTPGVIDVAADFVATADYPSLALSLIDAIEREANAIAVTTRQGKGTFVVVTPRIASIIAIGVQSAFSSEVRAATSFRYHDATRVAYLGTLPSGLNVYIDPFVNEANGAGFTVGFKDPNTTLSAGYFFLPYVPMQLYRGTDSNNYQSTIGVKTRFAQRASVWVDDAVEGTANSNPYFRRVTVTGL